MEIGVGPDGGELEYLVEALVQPDVSRSYRMKATTDVAYSLPSLNCRAARLTRKRLAMLIR
jgi:hypothetical protein